VSGRVSLSGLRAQIFIRSEVNCIRLPDAVAG